MIGRLAAWAVWVGTLGTPAMASADWLRFLGSHGNGTSEATRLPTHFGPTENVAWKVPLPGRGPSSPIVVAGRVLVTCSSGPRQDRLHVLAFDFQTGQLLWERQLWATGHTICNPFSAVAAPTPASDGTLVFAFYSSNDLACFDLDGNLKWFRGLSHERPSARNDVGMASSPVVVGETVIVQVDNEGDPFVAGIDKHTGQDRWRLARQPGALWSTPAVLHAPNPADDRVLLQSRSVLLAIDPHTGREAGVYDHWCDTMASAVTDQDRVYLPAAGIHALAYDWKTSSLRWLWTSDRLRGSAPSPAVCGGRLYVLKPPGIAVCADAETGEILWQLRLKGNFWASPVIADGHLYAVNYEGLVHVVRLGDTGELVGTGQVDSGILASPAVSDGALLIRSDAHLWKIALPGN